MTTIYVGNLPFTATEDEVRALFERHGKVESVKLINDRETGRPRGFAFVDMAAGEAQNAIQQTNGFQMGGRPLRVNEAKERAPRSKPASGGGGGGGGGPRRWESAPSRVGMESVRGGPWWGYSRLHSPHFFELRDHVDRCRFSLSQTLHAAHVAQRNSLAAIQYLVGHESALGAVDVRIAVLGLLSDGILERR